VGRKIFFVVIMIFSAIFSVFILLDILYWLFN